MYIGAIAANLVKAFGIEQKAVAELMTKSKEIGLEGLQFRPGREVPLDAPPEVYAWVRDVAKNRGMIIPGTGAGPNLVNPEVAEQSVARFDLIFRQCKALGGRIITGEVKAKPSSVSDSEAWATVEANVRKLAFLAEEHDVVFALEPGPNCFIRLPEELDELCNRVNHPRIGINFDGGNLAMAGADPIKSFEMLQGRIVGVHAKDATIATGQKKGRETPLGDGDVDYPALVKMLHRNGFNEGLIIEREVGETVLEDVKSGVVYLRSILANL